MSRVLLFSLTSMANPTLIAATTVMLVLPNPKKLMLGYLIGALLMSITLGLVIVFALQDSHFVATGKHTINPLVDLAAGAILVLIGFVLATDRDRPVRERRVQRSSATEKKTPRWQQWLSRGNPKITFVIGAALTLPGASYLAGLTTLSKLHYGTVAVVFVVLLFNVIMLALIEVPLICFTLAPEWTPAALDRAKAGLRRHGRRILQMGLIVLGSLLILRGGITLLT
jgi:Sap, sulfolipid-1-addressing protein